MLVYFRGYGNWFINDGSGYSKYENKIEHREIDPSHPRSCRTDFYRPNDIIEGLFNLTDSDEELYKKTGIFNKDHISRLEPCQHSDSAFKKLVENGKCSGEVFSRCYFEIETNKYLKMALRKRPWLVEEGKLHFDLFPYKSESEVLVYFSGHGAWFLNAGPNDWFGPRLSRNFVYKDHETGETESTDEFGRLYDGIEQKYCNEHTGYFKLTPKDAVICLESEDPNDLSHVEKLLPCSHQYSAFLIAVEDGHISKEAYDNCFFMIQKDFDRECFEHKKMTIPPYDLNNDLRSADKSNILKNKEEITVNTVITATAITTIEHEGVVDGMNIPTYLNVGHDLFSKELSIAIEAWQAVIECSPDKSKQGTVKQQIIHWLEKNKPGLIAWQKNRIAILVNPDIHKPKKDRLSLNQNIALSHDNHKFLNHSYKNHSSGLRVAVEAWVYVLQCNPKRPKTGSRKQIIESWLAEHYPAISKSNKDRITTLINPDSNGGVSSTN